MESDFKNGGFGYGGFQKQPIRRSVEYFYACAGSA